MRLKRKTDLEAGWSKTDFNSTVVRLKPCINSFPIWSSWNFNSTVVRLKLSLMLSLKKHQEIFQFYCSAIKTNLEKMMGGLILHFNSTVVRLKRWNCSRCSFAYCTFQFYCSAIKTKPLTVFISTMYLFQFYCSAIKTLLKKYLK